MKILDKYLLKKYFTTFFFTLILLIPVAIAIDISQKIHKFIAQEELTSVQIANQYYLNFVIFYVSMFMPLALFISTILFVSKLANNTEIIAINNGGVSFNRLIRPFLLGSIIVFGISFFANHFIVPDSNNKREAFEEKYLRKRKKEKRTVQHVNLQLNEKGDYIYIKDFNLINNSGSFFSFEKFNNEKLTYKLYSRRIIYNKKDSTFTLKNYRKRIVKNGEESIFKGKSLDTVFNFKPSDLVYVDYLAQAMNSPTLYKQIKKSEKRGVKNLNAYRVELYKRSSVPFSAIILTLIAFILAHKKKRGGMGINLAFGVTLMFIYVFFMKVTEVLGAEPKTNALLLVWIPNIIFSIIALSLYYNAKK